MKGLTNAVATSGASGGDIIYAINNTGADITKGQKVWLNKHNLDENVAYQYNSGVSNSNFLVKFDNDDNFLIFNTTTTFNDFYMTYDTSTKTWNLEELSSKPVSITNPRFIRYIDDIAYIYSTSTVSNDTSYYTGVVDRDRATAYHGIYLGNGYRVGYKDSKTFFLEHTGENSEITTTEIAGFNGYLTTAFMSGDKIFIMDNKGNYKICTSNGEVIKEITNTIFQNNYPIQFFTGLNSGDYIFFNTGNSQNSYEATTLNILQFDDNYNIVEPLSISEDLRALIGKQAFVQYYNNFKKLTVGTATNVYLFDFSNGTFLNMNVTISLPTESDIHSSGGVYRFFISEDMTSAVITYRRQTSSSVYFASGWYKLKTLSDDWYADTYLQFSANTLTGIATGVTDLQKKYEVKTVLE